LYSPMIIGGRMAPSAVGGQGATSLDKAVSLKDITIERLGDDMCLTGYPH
ncbi:MAG: riboflavin biosynthesis protein RibD, partial [Acidobacteria bacterium]|nr:riboflavin biosynthesis protein RibD [Acidobacteriota bacterium]